MNFSEYVALLSGNTDLLEKSKIEKKIAALESERQAFLRSKWSSLSKLESTAEELQTRKMRMERMTVDWNNFQNRMEKYEDGNIKNMLIINNLSKQAGLKEIGATLNKFAATSRTAGAYEEIGSLYGFQILVKTEIREHEDRIERDNRFFICGEGNIKYTHNNGIMANDPERASLNFLNALQKLPGIIQDEQQKINQLKKDQVVLQEIVGGEWNKEKQLTALKTELASVERNIQFTLDKEKEDKIADSQQQHYDTAKKSKSPKI
ncbi:hypothetical protein [Sphingobacterium sp.]|uniref:hypothetical protein n=1 Tax=Sphingobacterium sp. TaxID=341027 RepID=UPI003FA74996